MADATFERSRLATVFGGAAAGRAVLLLACLKL